MVDEDHLRADRLGDAPDHFAESQRLLVGQARAGLVEEDEPRFAHDGARVIAADKDFKAAHETCAGLPNASPVKVDVTEREDVEAMLAKHDRIDVYFNNAGIPERVTPLADITRAEWDAVIDVNLTALFIAAQVAAPKLKGGVLLVTASIIANRPRAGCDARRRAFGGPDT